MKKTRVAVYCRVSTAYLEQMNSLENQIDYFKSLVQQNLQWTLVDIYSDVQSGKNNGRAEFQRMIHDCMDNKIDLIITKSVSRFGRNTVETLEVLRKLKLNGVEVFF